MNWLSVSAHFNRAHTHTHIHARTQLHTSAHLDGEAHWQEIMQKKSGGLIPVQLLLDSVTLMLKPLTTFHWLHTSGRWYYCLSVHRPSVKLLRMRLKKNGCCLSDYVLYSPMGPWEGCWIDLSLILLCQNLSAKLPTKGKALPLSLPLLTLEVNFTANIDNLLMLRTCSLRGCASLFRTAGSRYRTFFCVSSFFFH